MDEHREVDIANHCEDIKTVRHLSKNVRRFAPHAGSKTGATQPLAVGNIASVSFVT